MSISKNLPQISVLLQALEKKIELKPTIHADFEKIREEIFQTTREWISESTLERLWGYSTRGSHGVSLHTLNLLSLFLGYKDWGDFCEQVKKSGRVESDMFPENVVSSSDLSVGDELVISWQPDRLCNVKYLGDDRFEVFETQNTKIHSGDTFTCRQFQETRPAYLENVKDREGVLRTKRYGVGLENGIKIQRLGKPN